MLVLAPTLTVPVPLMLPETKMIFLSSPLTASVRSERLETVTVVPPAPPVVLSEPGISGFGVTGSWGRNHNSPSVGGSIADLTLVVRAGTLEDLPIHIDGGSGRGGNKAHQRGDDGGEEELHVGLCFSEAV